VENGERIYHNYHLSVVGPTVTLLNSHLFVTDLKVGIERNMPLIIRNDSLVDVEVLLMHEDAQNLFFN